MLNQMFYGRVDASTAKERPEEMQPDEWQTWYRLPILIFVFVLQSLLLPFYVLKFSPTIFGQEEGSECRKGILSMREMFPDPKKRPVVTVYGYLFSYFVFLGFVILHIVTDREKTNFTWNEWIILLYVISMVLNEINQLVSLGRKYVTFTNFLDDFKILGFCIFLILRAIGTANRDLDVLRVAEHVFAVAAMLSFLRPLYYLPVNRKLGPMLISIREVTREVFLFIIILLIVLIAFSVAISGVYGAGVYTIEFQNGSISLPPLVHG